MNEIEKPKSVGPEIEESIHTDLSPNMQRALIMGASVLSAIFKPAYYPTVAFFFLLNLPFFHLPVLFKLYVLFMVYMFTVVFPSLGVRIYRQLRAQSIQRLREHHRRLVPYVIHILCYLACIHYIWRFHFPRFVTAILLVSVLVQMVCTVITIWWKISLHSAAAGTLIGVVVAYGFLLNQNPIWWLCLAILLSGLVNSSRMLLRRHTLGQVVGGTCVGIVCGLLVINFF